MARTTIRTDDITATGTASSSTYLRGDGAWGEIASAGFNSVQTFTSSGTWTRPSGITKVIVEVQGAGGSGGNSSVSNGGGGAGGGYAKKFLDVSSISTSTITVGSGGAGTSGSSSGNGGGSSSWADGTNTITGGGGGGGVSYPGASTAGTASGGDININGGRGFFRGHQGQAFLGVEAVCDAGGSGQTGFAGGGYGWGSGTAYNATSVNGGDGIVIVWEYK